MRWQTHWPECFAHCNLNLLHHLLVILDQSALRHLSPTAPECQARLPMCPLAAMSSSQTLTPKLEFSFRLRRPVINTAKHTGKERRMPDRPTPACALLFPKLLCSPPPLRPLTWESIAPRAWGKSATSERQLRLCAEPEWVEPDIPPDQVIQDTSCLGHRTRLLLSVSQLSATLYSINGAELQGLTPLYQAVEDHNLELVKSILASGSDTHLDSWTKHAHHVTPTLLSLPGISWCTCI